MQLDPIPQLDRQDLREFIEKQYELFNETLQEEEEARSSTTRQAEGKL